MANKWPAVHFESYFTLCTLCFKFINFIDKHICFLKFYNEFACFDHSELLFRVTHGIRSCYSNGQHMPLRTSRHCNLRTAVESKWLEHLTSFPRVTNTIHLGNTQSTVVNSTICKPIWTSADIYSWRFVTAIS